jgi:hypothetical protein
VSLLLNSVLILPNSVVKEELTSERCAESSLVILVLISAISLLKMFSISGVLFFISRSLTILVICAESSSKIFCLRFDYMVVILMNNTGPMNKKTAVKAKNGILSEELNEIKLNITYRQI